MKKQQKVIYLVVLIFVLAFVLYFLGTRPKVSKFKLENKTKQIEKTKEYGDTIVGWVTVEGTNIDLPIVQDSDILNMKDRDYDYISIYSIPGNDSNHVSLISHNIRNVSRKPILNDNTMKGFEQLVSFIYPSFVKENQYIAYTDRYGNQSMYKIYAVALINYSQAASYKNVYTDKEQEEYIEKSKKESMYDIDTDVVKEDKLISLLTCTRFYGAKEVYSFRVDARELRSDEKQELSKVKTNKNYEKIEKCMKEGDTNEEA